MHPTTIYIWMPPKRPGHLNNKDWQQVNLWFLVCRTVYFAISILRLICSLFRTNPSSSTVTSISKKRNVWPKLNTHITELVDYLAAPKPVWYTGNIAAEFERG